MAIGDKLQKLLEERRMNVSEVSAATGVNINTIYSIIRRNSKKASIDDLIKIAHYLGVTADYFCDNEPDEEQYKLPGNELLRKFSCLDSYGKEVVEAVINIEYERCTSKK